MRQKSDREQAEMIAIRALRSLASDQARLGSFLAVTGLGPESLRAAAADKDFLVSILDYIVSDESLLVLLAGNLGVPPESFTRAHAFLSEIQRNG
ncbi:MAG: DUF3572 domain-containing protein [Hyphomicrobiales bacterium]|nr:DUF3572 domain-containing protein [Hyphomicrobiales bacterium]